MRNRVIISTFVAIVLLAAAIAAGLNAVFTVTNVRAEFETSSEAGRTEAAAIEEKLGSFVGRSMTFLDPEEVRAVVEENPHFRVAEVRKEYPTTVVVTVAERKETFAFLREGGGYAVFDEDGKYLYEKEDASSTVGGACILLENFTLSTADRAPAEGEYFDAWMEIVSVLREELGEYRANVVSVRVVSPVDNSAHDDFFRITMREGLVIDIGNPAWKAAEKMRAALTDGEDGYLSLSDEERVFGFITVIDSTATQEVIPPDYSRESYLADPA